MAEKHTSWMLLFIFFFFFGILLLHVVFGTPKFLWPWRQLFSCHICDLIEQHLVETVTKFPSTMGTYFWDQQHT